MRKAVWALLVSVTAVGILLLFVFPVRTLLTQDRQIGAVRHEITVLDQENSRLAARSAALNDPSTIEQLARSQYGMVLPGERAYAVLPARPVPPRPAAGAHHAARRPGRQREAPTGAR